MNRAGEGAQTTDEPVDNVARVRDFVLSVEQEGHLERIDAFVAPDFRDLTAGVGLPGDRDGVRMIMKAIHDAFSDIRVDIVHCVGSGDVVATYKVFHARHVGNWMGAAASGGRIELRVMDFMRLRDGRQVEHWAIVDQLRGARRR